MYSIPLLALRLKSKLLTCQSSMLTELPSFSLSRLGLVHSIHSSIMKKLSIKKGQTFPFGSNTHMNFLPSDHINLTNPSAMPWSAHCQNYLVLFCYDTPQNHVAFILLGG